MKKSLIGGTERLVLVTTIRFNNFLKIGDPVSQAKIYEAQAADELIFLDIEPSSHNLNTMVEIVRNASEGIFMPFTVGGGVRCVQDFKKLLSNGADKISINSEAVKNRLLIKEASRVFGSQCIVLSIDYKKTAVNTYRVYIDSGKTQTNLDPVWWAREGEKLGAGEILLTSIDCDGTRQGLDLELTRAIAESVSIPVVTSGGCGTAKHFVEGFTIGKADAVSAGTYFSFKDENPMQTRARIKNAGIPIRIHT